MANGKSVNNEASEPDPTSDEIAQSKTPPKRAQRQRNPVILLQHDYYQMYDDKNNRSRKRKRSARKNSVSSPIQTKGSSSSNSNNSKKRKTTKSTSEKNISNSSSPSLASKSIFSWVGPSIEPPPISDNTRKHDTSNKSIKKHYQRIEINVGNHPALVALGDYVLISSADYEEKDLRDKAQTISRSPTNMESRNAVVNDMMGNSDDDDSVLNSTLKSEKKMDVAMNSLDPYIGRVEEMWEEPKGDKKEKDPYSRMKVLVRWLFKKCDVEGLKGEFVGIPREKLLSSMSPRDVLLGEQTDINEITTILGRCRVLRLKPPSEEKPSDSSDPNKKEGDDNSSQQEVSSKQHPPKGAFFCRYDIVLTPAKTSGRGKITITPYDGPDEEDEADEPSKRDREESIDSQDIEAVADGGSAGSESNSGATESIDNGSKAPEDDDSSLGTSDRRNRKQPSITEGNATLKIKVGSEHQADIPPQINKRKYAAIRKSPLKLWKPQSITDTKLNSYFNDAGKILKDYMVKSGMDMTRSLPHNVPPGISGEGPFARSSSHCAYREFDVDDLILLLHDHQYNTASALRGLKAFPQDYVFIWSKEDKELYNSGFQKHASNLHSISQNFRDTKNHKDVVDYHYRFKIPDQFKRFQDLKREQARRMLEAGERLRLNEYLSEGRNDNNGISNGMKKSHQWSRNGGGGPDQIGEVEARRLECKKFLFEVRDVVGEDQYLILVNLLKSLNSKVITIPQMKGGFTSVLKKHPSLLTQFETYLPEMSRNKTSSK